MIIIKKICILLSITFIMCSCNLNGYKGDITESKDIGNIYVGGCVASTKDMLYYIEENNGEVGLYVSNLKLENKKKICDGYYSNMNIYKEKIYYTDFNGIVYSMNIDGSEKIQLTDFCIDYMYIFDEKIFCLIADANRNLNEEWKNHEYNLISMNTDGTDIKILCEKEVRRFYIYKNQLYYVTYDTGHRAVHKDTGYFRKMNLDGTNDELVVEMNDFVYTFSIFEDYIYYVCPPGRIVRRGINDKRNKEYILDNEVQQIDYFINIHNPYIIYRDSLKGFFVYNINTGEKSNVIQNRDNPSLYDYKNRLIYDTSLYIVEDRCYFYQNGKIEYISIDHNTGGRFEVTP